MIIISDNSPLSGLLAIDKLELLKELYGSIIIPNAVKQELDVLETKGINIAPILEADWIEVKTATISIDLLDEDLLDEGEKEAIQLSIELKADKLIIDENKGRKVAKNLNIPIIGLLGVLIEAKQKQLIPSLKQCLNDLSIKSSFRLHPDLIDKSLKLVGED